ncbi:spore coat protein GerQ [Paenibacillus aestuarii]|uniref:Spore coat protein GerQ n=1 Tax=Paenibacillus aestuarii TaxID=516965 RepID=A0ABW0K2X5_9BACL|nr:spore coat protein GerQ [Paenibacillus aestuarii]
MMNNPYKAGMQVPYGYPYPLNPAHPTATPPAATPTGPATYTGVPGAPGQIGTPGQLPMEQSFIENILRLNLGKMATLYMTYENNSEWNAKIFKGRLEAAGRDHIIISDPTTGMRYLLLMVNLDYITFDEELNYYYPYGGGQGTQVR